MPPLYTGCAKRERAEQNLTPVRPDVGPFPRQVLTRTADFCGSLDHLTLTNKLIWGQVTERAMGRAVTHAELPAEIADRGAGFVPPRASTASWVRSFRRGPPKPPSYSSFTLPSVSGETSFPVSPAKNFVISWISIPRSRPDDVMSGRLQRLDRASPYARIEQELHEADSSGSGSTRS